MNISCSIAIVAALFPLAAETHVAGQITKGNVAGSLLSVAPNFAWSIIPSPRRAGASSHLYGVSTVSATDAWAVGDRESDEGAPLVYHWNGSRWSEIPAAPLRGGSLTDIVAVSSNDIWAVGHQDVENAADLSVTQHWDGTTWTQVPSPNPSRDPSYGE